MKIKAEYSVCGACFLAITNGDYTSLDYYYTEEEAKVRKQEIQKGIKTLGPHLVPGNKGYGFCRTPCECCGDKVHGLRCQIIQLGEG